MECCNYDCTNRPSGRHIRCAICRRKSIAECCVCGIDITSSADTLKGLRAVKCKPCALYSRRQAQLEGQTRYNKTRCALLRKHHTCVTCDNPLPKWQHKFCSNKCSKQSLRWRLRINKNCLVCKKSLIDSGRYKTCSRECFVEHNRRRCRDNYHIRNKQMVRLNTLSA